METTIVQRALSELKRVSRRISRITAAEERYNDFLCRSSDGCWDYPDADEKYEMYIDKIGISDQRLQCLDEAQEAVNTAISKFDSLLKII